MPVSGSRLHQGLCRRCIPRVCRSAHSPGRECPHFRMRLRESARVVVKGRQGLHWSADPTGRHRCLSGRSSTCESCKDSERQRRSCEIPQGGGRANWLVMRTPGRLGYRAPFRAAARGNAPAVPLRYPAGRQLGEVRIGRACVWRQRRSRRARHGCRGRRGLLTR